jgi:hypothetical protein
MDKTLLKRCPLSRPVRDVKNLNHLLLLFHAEQNPIAAENQVSDFVAVETQRFPVSYFCDIDF